MPWEWRGHGQLIGVCWCKRRARSSCVSWIIWVGAPGGRGWWRESTGWDLTGREKERKLSHDMFHPAWDGRKAIRVSRPGLCSLNRRHLPRDGELLHLHIHSSSESQRFKGDTWPLTRAAGRRRAHDNVVRWNLRKSKLITGKPS